MQQSTKAGHGQRRTGLLALALGSALLGGIGGQVLAQMSGPTEHKGISVDSLGELGEASLSTQIGLTGYYLQLRRITIKPGGQIKEHSHATRPGIVQVLSGVMVEGRPDGETTYSENDLSLLETADTVHWVYNRGDVDATAIVCGIAANP